MLDWQPMVQLGRRAGIRLPGVSNPLSIHSKGNKSAETHTTRHPHDHPGPPAFLLKTGIHVPLGLCRGRDGTI